MINITLPQEVKDLTEKSLFDNDGLLRDDMLSKYLAYTPEVVRIFGLAIIDLKKTRRQLELKVKNAEREQARVKARIILKLDPGVYKNEELRSAKVLLDEEYIEVGSVIVELEEQVVDCSGDIDELSEDYWKHKNMQKSLDSLTKLRLSERHY